MAVLRSVSLTEQPSRNQQKTLSYAENSPEISSIWGDAAISYLVCVGWAWHAPRKGGSVGDSWSEG